MIPSLDAKQSKKPTYPDELDKKHARLLVKYPTHSDLRIAIVRLVAEVEVDEGADSLSFT